MVTPYAYLFGKFRLLPGPRLLIADGAPQKLGGRAFDVLLALVEQSERTVSKNELIELVWPKRVVQENNLQVQMVALRKLLGRQAFATVPGRGYRFTMPVVVDGGAPADDRPTLVAIPHAVGTDPRPGNLPIRPPTLFGRGDDVAAVDDRIARRRLVTVVGAGGIGKTLLAQAVAIEARARFPDGVWWIELATLSEGSVVAATVARVLGIRLSNDADATRVVVAAIRTQALLLVLDNCEHVLESVGHLVAAIRSEAADVRLLVTSQEALKHADESVYRIEPLALPKGTDAHAIADSSAGALFVARATDADRRFVLSDANAGAIGAICRHLDGIPLAIEFAAARLPLLGVEGVRTKLGERFNVLTAGARVVLRRHQTLRAALEWSHGLLTAPEKTVFRRLGVFAAGFTLELAQSVANDDAIDAWDVLEHLGALVDKSLVQAQGDPVPRYRMLETTRLFALECLAEAGETNDVPRRHAEVMLRRLESACAARWHAPSDTSFGAELDNVRAAMDWSVTTGERALAVALCAQSLPLWLATVLVAEGVSRCELVRPWIDDTTPPATVARFHLTIGYLGLFSSRAQPFRAALDAADRFAALGDRRGEYEACVARAGIGARRHDHEAARAAVARAGALVDPTWPALRRSSLAFASWLSALRAERYDEALEHGWEQVALYREAGRPDGEAIALGNVGGVETRLGRAAEGEARIRDAIARLAALGMSAYAGHMVYDLSIALTQRGAIDEAYVEARRAFELLRRRNDHAILLEGYIALLATRGGDLDTGARVAGFIDAANGRESVPPHRLQREALDALQASMPADRLARLMSEGASLAETEVYAMVLERKG